MKKQGWSLKIKLADIPWGPSQRQKSEKYIETLPVPGIPYRDQLCFLVAATDVWFRKSFKRAPPSSRDFDARDYWKQFRNVFENNSLGKDALPMTIRYAKENANRSFKIDQLSQKLQQPSSKSDQHKLLAELFALCLLEPASLGQQLFNKVVNISTVWLINPPATMNADSLEYLLGGFVFGRFLEVARNAEKNTQAAIKYKGSKGKAKLAVEKYTEKIVEADHEISASKLVTMLGKYQFDGFRVQRSDKYHKDDNSWKHRYFLEAHFTDGSVCPLPRADDLLRKFRQFRRKRRSR